MDYLDHLIELSQIEGEINILCRFYGDWQIDHPKTEDQLGIFHIVSQGQCCLLLDGKCLHLRAGDVIFLPYGVAHRIFSAKDTSTATSEIPIVQQSFGAFTLCTQNTLSYDFEMFCGSFRYAGLTESQKFTLPQWHLSSQNQHILALLGLLRYETTPQPANQVVINALCRVLFTYLVRDYLEQNQVEHGMLAVLQDKRLRHAVQAMLDNPENDWDMESLAQLCAMSRSNFIRVFKEKCGISAGRFLTTVRLQKAMQLLKDRSLSIQQVALAVGYQSEAHFSKLFKQYTKQSPGILRKTSG